MAGNVVYQGQTNSLTGNGNVNSGKLFLPNLGTMPAPISSAFRQVMQFVNSMTATAFTTISHTYSVSGTLAVPSGATNYLPPFFRPVGSFQGIALTGVRYFCRAGTATMNIQQNGVTVNNGGALSVSTTATSTSLYATTSNNDYFAPVLTAASGADGLSVSFEFSVIS